MRPARGGGAADQRQPRVPGAHRRLRRLRQPRRPAAAAHAPDARAERGRRTVLRGARPGVAQPGHRDDVLRVRPHAVGQRRCRHRPRHVGAALRVRRQRQGRAVRPAAVDGRARAAGTAWRITSTSGRTTRRSSTAGWAAVRATCSAATSRTSACSAAGRATCPVAASPPGPARSRRRRGSCRCRPRRIGRHPRRHGRRAAARSSGPSESVRLKVAGVGRRSRERMHCGRGQRHGGRADAADVLHRLPRFDGAAATSNINGGPGRPVPNLVVMGVGDDGCIEVFNSHGETHCLVDVFGYFTSRAPATGSSPLARAGCSTPAPAPASAAARSADRTNGRRAGGRQGRRAGHRCHGGRDEPDGHRARRPRLPQGHADGRGRARHLQRQLLSPATPCPTS